MFRTLIASCVALVIAMCGAQAQAPGATPLKSFAEVAGKWEGLSSPSGVKVALEVNDKGAFSVSSRLGEEKGTATLENGLLLVRYTSNQGYLKLAMIGGALGKV